MYYIFMILTDISQKITSYSGISLEYQINIFQTIVAFFIVYFIKHTILKIVWSRTEDVKVRYSWNKAITYSFWFIFILVTGKIWISDFITLSTFFGLLSAGIAIALKDIITSIAGWIFLLVRRPFKVGDRIEINNVKGDVIDIKLLNFTLLEISNWVDAEQSTGRLVHIPNSWVFLYNIATYTEGFQYIWNEIPVLITFESDWKKAKKIIKDIVETYSEGIKIKAKKEILEASRNYMIYYQNLTPIIYTDVKDSGILLTARYLCHPRQRRGSTNEIWELILDAFAEYDNIDLAYPTQRIYYP